MGAYESLVGDTKLEGSAYVFWVGNVGAKYFPLENLIPRQNLDLMVVPLLRSRREVESVEIAAAKENTINEYCMLNKLNR